MVHLFQIGIAPPSLEHNPLRWGETQPSLAPPYIFAATASPSYEGHTQKGFPMATIKLSNYITVRTFPKAPEGFDPLKSEDRLLARYGFPSRPSDPRLAARWESVMSRGLRFIEPEFRAMPYKRRRLPQTARGEHGVETSDIWSGAVVHAPAGDTFRWVEGTWTVPNAYPPGNAQDNVWYSASTWVGIDGIDGSGDVLQAGCDSDVMTQ